jgi:hypothetical protein
VQILVWVLALWAGPDADQRASDFFDRIQFEAPSEDTNEARRVAEVLQKREHWVGAYKALELQLGPMPDNLTVKVDFGLEGTDAGWGGSNGIEAKVRFNLKRLGELQKKVDEFEAKRKEAQSRGQTLVFRVPPIRLERLIYHELTHVFQRGCQGPGWFMEGMAQLIGDDPNNIAGFANANKKVQAIDEGSIDRADSYARGHLFWKWLEGRGSAKKAAELVVFQHRPWKEALEEATGLPWALVTLAERDWSTKEVEKLQPKEAKGR